MSAQHRAEQHSRRVTETTEGTGGDNRGARCALCERRHVRQRPLQREQPVPSAVDERLEPSGKRPELGAVVLGARRGGVVGRRAAAGGGGGRGGGGRRGEGVRAGVREDGTEVRGQLRPRPEL